jgi:hypothetical protein
MDPKHSRDAVTKSVGTERIAAFSDSMSLESFLMYTGS